MESRHAGTDRCRDEIGLGEVGGIAEEAAARQLRTAGRTQGRLRVRRDDQAVRQARADGVAWASIYQDSSASAPFDRSERDIVRLGGSSAQVVPAKIRPCWSPSAARRQRAPRIRPRRVAAARRCPRRGARDWHGIDPARSTAQPSRRRSAEPVPGPDLPLIVKCDRLADIRQASRSAAIWADDRDLRRAEPGPQEPSYPPPHPVSSIRWQESLPDSYDTLVRRPDSAALLAEAGVPMAFSVSAQGLSRSWTGAIDA